MSRLSTFAKERDYLKEKETFSFFRRLEDMADLAAILSRRRAATDEAQDSYSTNGDAILERARLVANRPKDPVSHTSQNM